MAWSRGAVWSISLVVVTCRAQVSPEVQLKGLNETTFTFAMTDRSCLRGLAKEVSLGEVIVHPGTGSGVTLHSADIAQVALGDGTLLYSARSSWSDVMKVKFVLYEKLAVTLHNGKRIEAKPDSVSASALVFSKSEKPVAKDDVVTVDYVETVPVSDGFSRWTLDAGPLVFFTPQGVGSFLNLRGKRVVRLYDATRIQDDKPGVEVCGR